MKGNALDQWHHVVEHNDVNALKDLLADDAVFYSPVVHTPQAGKQKTLMYLMGALAVLGNGNFRYLREIVGEHEAMLEFQAELDGIEINGVDIITWNADQKITGFKVMVRPLKAINLLHQKMGEMLEAMK